MSKIKKFKIKNYKKKIKPILQMQNISKSYGQLNVLRELNMNIMPAKVASDFEEVGDADVVRKVLGDLSQAGSEITETELRKRMNILGDGARQQIEDELL